MKDLYEIYKQYHEVKEDVVMMNIGRVFYMSLLSMPINLLSAIYFLFFVSAETNQEIQWRKGIILSHLVLFSIMCIFVVSSFYLFKKESPNKMMYFLQNAMTATLILFGSVITAIDQWTIDNITAFLIVCAIIGTVLLIRPLYAVMYYIVGYGAFYYLVGFTQSNEAILASNRVNGMFSISIGICLSIVLWRANAMNIQQRRLIQKQNEDLEEKNRELQFIASYDALTGLLSRRQFAEFIDQELNMMQQSRHQSCIVLMDIDHFKKINDTYGHLGGDIVLKEISFILKENVREVDLVSRWGGEEFLLLFSQTTLSEGKSIVEKIRGIIEKTVFVINDYRIHVTASFGVAKLHAEFPATFDTFL